MAARLVPAGRVLRAPLLLAAAAAAVHLWPAAGLNLEYDREAIAAGQLWRLATGHWCHWSADHLLLDALVLVLVAAVYRARGGRLLGTAIAASTVAISAGLWLLLPEISRYRGLSGIDAGLTVLLAATMLREAIDGGDLKQALSALAAVAALAAKVVFELSIGHAAFVDSLAAGFVPVPLAHLVGAAAGAVVAFIPRQGVSFAPWSSGSGVGEGAA
jgi:rhomboid family GlyGly-CTERM serine protease